jgi:hypothetical protein
MSDDRRKSHVLTQDEQRYAIVMAPSVEQLMKRINILLSKHACGVVGGPTWMSNGNIAQAVMFTARAGTLADKYIRCRREDCTVEKQCARHRVEQDPWLIDVPLSLFFGGPGCDHFLVKLDNECETAVDPHP